MVEQVTQQLDQPQILSFLVDANGLVNESLQRNLDEVNARTWELYEPTPDILISEWAERNIVLAKGTSPKPGPYVPEVFQRFIMDVICDPLVRRLTVRKSTQIGWTQIILAIAGFFMDIDPKPVGLFFPREQDAKEKSKKAIAPMIEGCPALKSKVYENRSRRGGNTQLLKQYPGGFLKIGGTNTGAGLRSDSLAVVLKDEVDGWVLDVDGEGSPSDIVERRTDAYIGEEKILEGSTPAKPKGQSPIDNGYLAGNQTQFHVPCPFCGFYQPFLWRDPETKEYNLYWDKDAKGKPIPTTVRYRCKNCREGIEERHKQIMLEKCKPIALHPEIVDHVSVSIWAMYAPWGDIWPVLAKEWHAAQGNPEKMRAFVNLRLGETWDEGADAIEPTALAARRRAYDPEANKDTPPRFLVPANCCLLICTVDVQAGRLEAQITGFGPGEEEWLIDHEVFYGSPLDIPKQRGNEDTVNVWSELDDYLLRTWKHENGAELRPSITLIDTGYASDACYNFILPRQTAARRVFAIKGKDVLSKLSLVQEGKIKNNTIRLFSIATYAIKDRILDRLKVAKPGPQYMHFPEWTSEDYFSQITAESRVPVKNRKTGRTRFEWVMNQTRNEALDLTVYAHAGLWILQKIIDPVSYNDLTALAAAVQMGQAPATMQAAVGRRVLSRGVQ